MMKDYVLFVYDNYLQEYFQKFRFTRQHVSYLMFLLTVFIGLGYYLPTLFLGIFIQSFQILLALIIAVFALVFFAFLALFIYKTVVDYRENLYSSGDVKYDDSDDEED